MTHVLSCLMCFVPYRLFCPTCLVSYVPSCFTCSRAQLTSCPTCSSVPRASCLVCSCASRTSCPACSHDPRASWHLCSRTSRASCLTCFVPYVPSCFMNLFSLHTPSFSYLEFACFTFLFFCSFPNCDFLGKFTKVSTNIVCQ